LIDCTLSDCCYSFRNSKRGIPRTHHDAVENLINFSSIISLDSDLWVAECDIQGFFDCISHDLILSKLLALEKNISSVSDNSKIVHYVEKFLEGYSYKKAKFAAEEYLKSKSVTNFILFDNEKNLQKFSVLKSDYNYGIPQGSALSTVFANLVLSDTDKKIESILGNNGSFYARFCDDVILMSIDKRKCTSAIHQYCLDLNNLQLPYHELESVSVQNKKFWSTKSKKPYRWVRAGKENGVHWIGFVGYQMTRNGKVRIREASIKREICKQKLIIKQVCQSISKKVFLEKQTKRSIEFDKISSIEKKVQSHMVARSTGIKKFGLKSTRFKTWSSGFKLLERYDIDKKTASTT
jgi:hypothetical protein